MTDSARARRLGDRIREIVADLLEHQVKDPRLGFVTVTDARITADLRDATVFYTVYGDDLARQETAMALRSATGVIRSEVGRRTGVKFTPTLSFVADVVPDHARTIEVLLTRARAADERVHRVAEGARPAGEPDPYRRGSDEAAAQDGAAPSTGLGAAALGRAAVPPRSYP
jgi:ribosome-binding factor A